MLLLRRVRPRPPRGDLSPLANFLSLADLSPLADLPSRFRSHIAGVFSCAADLGLFSARRGSSIPGAHRHNGNGNRVAPAAAPCRATASRPGQQRNLDQSQVSVAADYEGDQGERVQQARDEERAEKRPPRNPQRLPNP